MAKVIQLKHQPTDPINEIDITSRFKAILEKNRKGQLEPLTPEKLRRRPGLEQISDDEALAAIDTIKKLAGIFFEITCRNQDICIDNQHIVHLNKENKAA